MGKPEQAETVLRKLVELYPQEAAFRGLWSNTHRPKGENDAEKELRALGCKSDRRRNRTDLVRFLRSVRGPAAARQELVTRINGSAQAFEYQVALAEFDLAQGNVTDAFICWSSLLAAQKPVNMLWRRRLSWPTFTSAKNFDAAETLATEILRKDNRNGNGLKFRASIRLQRGQLDAAIADARQALNDQPQSAELKLLLATAYERSGSIELAEKQYADATNPQFRSIRRAELCLVPAARGQHRTRRGPSHRAGRPLAKQHRNSFDAGRCQTMA